MVTIFWDVDDVLNDLMRAWFVEAWKPSRPQCALSYADITENPPERILGVCRTEYLDSLDAYRASERMRDLEPNAGVLEWLREYGHRYRHVALTARPLNSAPGAAEWLFRHFGAWLRSFCVVPSRQPADVPVYDRDKREFLRWFGKPGILIDDTEENTRAAEQLGVRTILYPQPWNHSSLTVQETVARLSQLAEVN
jgi:FMN phosphatase YigB (HAD superfamily)